MCGSECDRPNQSEASPLTREEYIETYFLDATNDAPEETDAHPASPASAHICPAPHEASMLFISAQDATAIHDIRCELERARGLYPPFRSLASAVIEIQHRTDTLGLRLVASCGQMDAEVRRKLLQTAAMCIRALTENG